jgi:ubiquinone/menaquinone biosynthesis C-methylase UbiE
MRSLLFASLLASACAAPGAAPLLKSPGDPRGIDSHVSRNLDRFIATMDDPKRAAWQKPDEVVLALRLSPGQAVADIGAGTGYFTFRLARAVGPRGKVLSVDVEARLVELLRQRAAEAGARQVEAITTGPDDPGLPAGAVDLVFLCNTYHHIGDRVAWLRKLRPALRPGGRVVNIDFFKRPLPVGPPVERKRSRREVKDEFARAGYRFLEEVRLLPYQYFLVFAPGEGR